MTDSPYVSADANNVPTNERQSAALIAGWLNAAGLEADVLPCDRETAAAILAIGGQYRVDADELNRLANLGFTPDVQHYDARDLIAAASALESRRAWEYPSVHSPKLHYTARILEDARAAGPDAVAELRKMKRADLPFLLVLMVECENRELREQLLTTIRLVLETDHGVCV